MSNSLDYGKMMHNAMVRLMADILRLISTKGLPGEHHFYICFDTTYPDLDLPDWLQERYPEDMTIVIQHEYTNLIVSEDRFSIDLSFNDVLETLIIPFAAIKTFVDPTVDFGLRFEEGDEPYSEDVPESPMIEVEEDTSEIEKPRHEAEIVSLDSFRKS